MIITRVAWWGLSLGLIRLCDVRVYSSVCSLYVGYLNKGLNRTRTSAEQGQDHPRTYGEVGMLFLLGFHSSFPRCFVEGGEFLIFYGYLVEQFSALQVCF